MPFVRSRRRLVIWLVVIVLAAAPAWWGVSLWQLQASVAAHERSWSGPHGEAGGLVYVALGDSTAQGIGASSPDAGYVGLLAQRLRDATGQPVQVRNLSVSGATIFDVTAGQLPRVQGLDADLVTVAVGANDIADYDRGRFDDDMRVLLAGLPPGTVVADVPDFMHGQARGDADEAATTVRRLAAQQDLVVAPVHAAVRRGGWPSMATDYAADLHHPNDRGYRVWADAFWQVIAPAGP